MATDLKGIPLFAGFPDSFFEAIRKCVVVKKFPEKAIIIWEGDECQSVYFVLEGQVELYCASNEGREQIIDRLGKGEAFNLAPVFVENPIQQATVRAIRPSTLAVIGQKDFLVLMDRFPESCKVIAQLFVTRLVDMTDSLVTISLHPVRVRLARFLIHEAESCGDSGWTQGDMARRLGTVRDVIGRVLRKFEDDELIRITRQRIMLLDRERLMRMAEGNE